MYGGRQLQFEGKGYDGGKGMSGGFDSGKGFQFGGRGFVDHRTGKNYDPTQGKSGPPTVNAPQYGV